MALRLLLAGFQDPKASGDAAGHLLEYAEQAVGANEPLQDIDLQVVRLPRSHERAPRLVVDRLRDEPPEYFLLVRTDRASTDYKLHVFAANYADDEADDEDGRRWTDRILDTDGPVAYRTRLPLDGVWDKFIVERVPVRMSHKAGTGVYNHVLYDVMRAVDLHALPTRCGALETPPLAGEEREGAQGRTADQIEDEFHMLLAVLSQLAPAAQDPQDKAT